ncbi:hypothetical protein COV93_01535 [Candidatus Woesearchaeota archaeon CG11_big_fil_rev_8_21_14_0_20_43_8]|nr:MAG: hypothetical protein COV93_01535 [Candidatus Woesearchaeota archaeon CG11_big_fil_rev_8_21_14_0_20_43_8]PIO05459.1 MAG: hypothetical protein COT47_04695 [Candidatus Woesearchaeota archaeon CG08_land_8_20_14_0_20_43_7]
MTPQKVDKRPKEGYFTTLLHNNELDAYLMLLRDIVRNTKDRDMDHHEYYDENVEEGTIDPEPIMRIEEELSGIEPNN